MAETPYQNREIREMVDDVRNSLQRIEIQTSYTNGKVRKIIIFLVLLGGIVIGQTFTNAHDIITLFAGFVTP